MENKQSASSQPKGICQKLFNVFAFRHPPPPATPPPSSTAAKKNSSLPPPVPLSFQKPIPAVHPGEGSKVALSLPEPSSVTKQEKEKLQPITKPSSVPHDTRTIEITGSSHPATVTRKQTIKEGGNAEAAAAPLKPKDIDELVEAFLNRARLKIRALSGVNEGKPST